MESVFEIIAEPNRRAILSLLVSSQQSVGEIERQLRMPQPTVSKHLRVLREAGFVESTVDAQRRLYRLKPEPLQEVDAWLAPFRRFWSAHVDALERHLDRMDRSTANEREDIKAARSLNESRIRCDGGGDGEEGRPRRPEGEAAVLAKIAAMPAPYRAMGERLHALILRSAPALQPTVWYGMPAYAKDGTTVCFFRADKKYMTFGFTQQANLTPERGRAAPAH